MIVYFRHLTYKYVSFKSNHMSYTTEVNKEGAEK
jgi:hypothetical protein